MQINVKKLLHLNVVTKSGIALGRVLDVELSAENHLVKNYCVGQRWLGKPMLIAPSQVVAITAGKMIVEDTVIKNKEKVFIKHKAVAPALGGAMPRNIE